MEISSTYNISSIQVQVFPLEIKVFMQQNFTPTFYGLSVKIT